MKRSLTAIVLTLALFVTPFFIGSACAGGNINFILGQKNLDSSDWEPLDEQTEFGLMMDFKGAGMPLSIAADILVSYDDTSYYGYNIEGETREFDFGIRKYFSITNQFSPYIGGGLALIRGEFSGPGGSDDDNGFGIWFSGGARFTFNQIFNVGLDLRYSKAEINLVGVDGEAGGTHFLLFAGFHF